jgi:hypothetical protein
LTSQARFHNWCVVGPRTIESRVTCCRFTNASNVSKRIPGAHGLRTCRTYHGPTRALVALRVLGLSESVQRGHGVDGSKLSVISRVSPQNGQTCPSALMSGGSIDVGGFVEEVVSAVTRVMSLATSADPSIIGSAKLAPSLAPQLD